MNRLHTNRSNDNLTASIISKYPEEHSALYLCKWEKVMFSGQRQLEKSLGKNKEQ